MAITNQKIASGLPQQNKHKTRGNHKMPKQHWSKYIHVNCRTCAHITPLSDSTWHCAKWDDLVPTEHQYAGCESHVLHPDLVPWKRLDSPSDWVAVYEINGLGVANGEPGEGVYGSKELLANAEACASGDEYLMKLRQEFNGRIVG